MHHGLDPFYGMCNSYNIMKSILEDTIQQCN